MYVKIAGNPVIMFDAGARVQWGVHAINDGREELGDPDWGAELDIEFESCTVELTTGPDDANVRGAPMWLIRYAYWNTETGIHGVVANTAIYIVGDNGKTIDKVR